MLTYEQHLEDLKSDRREKHRQSYEDVKMGVKRKNELVDAVPDNKKLKVFEHLKVLAENYEVSNEEVAKKSVVSEVNKGEKSVEEKCQLRTEKRGVKEESRERMSLVSEEGLWFLRSTASS